MRHIMYLRMIHRGHPLVRPEDGHEVSLEEALGGITFNAIGYWSEKLKGAEFG